MYTLTLQAVTPTAQLLSARATAGTRCTLLSIRKEAIWGATALRPLAVLPLRLREHATLHAFMTLCTYAAAEAVERTPLCIIWAHTTQVRYLLVSTFSWFSSTALIHYSTFALTCFNGRGSTLIHRSKAVKISASCESTVHNAMCILYVLYT